MALTWSLRSVLVEKQSWRALAFLALSLVVTSVLIWWCRETNSLALQAFTYLTVFDILRYERFEVLAIFASTLFVLLSGISVVKHGLERIVQPPDVSTSYLLLAVCLGLITHLQVTYGIDNKAYRHVSTAAGASWLQDAVADLGSSVCAVVPIFGRCFIPQFNPLALVALAASLTVMVSGLVIDNYGAMAADAVAAIFIAMLLSGTMLPLATYTGRILLQTIPEHVLTQLDKCLREASTLEGVLELRNEHFWMLSFGTLAGSLHVRVRRDANEQEVLAQVITRLSAVVSHLTVQIFKDDWSVPVPVKSNVSPAHPPLSNILPPSGQAGQTASFPLAQQLPAQYSAHIPLQFDMPGPTPPVSLGMGAGQHLSMAGVSHGTAGSSFGHDHTHSHSHGHGHGHSH